MSDLKIYPVKIDDKKLGHEEFGNLPPIPHLVIAVGKVKAGKTLSAVNLYCSKRFYGDKFDVKVLLCPSAYNDAVYKPFLDEFDYIITEINEEVIDELLNDIKEDETDNRYVFIFDDPIGSITQKRGGKPDLLSSLSTKYRHIANKNGDEGKLSIFLATQYFKHLTPILRNQATAYLLMGYFSKAELKSMGEALSIFGGSEEEFMKLYKECKKDKFDFLYLNMPQLKAYRNFDEELWSEEKLLNLNKNGPETDEEDIKEIKPKSGKKSRKGIRKDGATDE